MRKIILVVFCCFFAIGLLTTCDSPLSLGSAVNTKVPVIKLPDDSNGPGSFLVGEGKDGENRIFLEVEQEYGIESVYFEVEYIDKATKLKTTITVPAKLDPKTGLYYVDLDVSKMEDGTIKTKVKATDVSGNETISTDIIYNVKNTPPQIEINIPSIKGATFDDKTLNTVILPKDPVFIGFDIMGLATDNLGIAKGFPKIMFWPKDLKDVDKDGLPLPTADQRYNTWRSMVLPNTAPGQTATKFSWPMVNLVADAAGEGGYRLPKNISETTYLSPKNYRFRIWTQDLYGRDNFYPNRTDNTVNNGNPVDVSKHPNKFMEINYIAAEIPIISIRSIPQYYNGVGDFVVELGISSQSPLTSVNGWLTDKDDGAPKYTSGKYAAKYIPDTSTLLLHNYELTISEADAKAWRDHATEDGNMYLNLEAWDTNNKSSPPTYRQFIFDIAPATVTYDRPAVIASSYAKGTLTGGKYEMYYPTGDRPKWVTGKITVGGLSQDQFGIKKVYYHIGKLGDDKSTNRESVYKNAKWEDTKLDTNTPDEGWSGSVYAWAYTNDFNSYKNNASTKSLIQEYTSSTQDFILPAGMVDKNTDGVSSARFYLPFYVKVIDNADNQTIVHYKLCIDPNLDYPFADIAYPHEKDLIGGEVRVSGTASDNDWMHTVMIRIWDDYRKKYYVPTGVTPIYTATPLFPTFDGINTEAEKAGWFRANKQGDDMVVGWNYTVNSDNGLNPPTGVEAINVRIDVRAVDTKNPNHLTTSWTTADKVGWTTSMNVQFSSAIPTITQVKIKKANVDDRNYEEGIRASGNFTISMLITDKDDINSVKARFAGQGYTDVIKGSAVQSGLPTGWSITAPKKNTVTGRLESTFTIVCDTINTPYNIDYGKTGSITLDVQATNSHVPPYTTSGAYSIGIDNYYPNVPRSLSGVLETENDASGSIFKINGIAKDYGDGSGSIQGMERVLVYFEKAKIVYTTPGDASTRTVEGTKVYVNPRNRAIPASGTGAGDTFYSKTQYTRNGITWGASMPAMTTYPNVRDLTKADGYGGTNGPNVATFDKFPVLKLVDKTTENIGEVWESPHAMVIDRQELGEDTDSDEDGIFGEAWDGLADIKWQARMNTLPTVNFPDGPLMVHYIYMDKAGNAVHFQKDIFIINNKPVIKNINLGTDVDGNGSVTSWIDPEENDGEHGEYMYSPRTVEDTEAGNRRFDSSFRIRNNKFALKLETSGGNNTRTLKVSYVTSNGTIPATSMERGGVYTILTPGNTEWVKLGSPNLNPGTTFVSSGPASITTTIGSVTRYTEVSSRSQLFPSSGAAADIENTLFSTTGHFTNIPDSTKYTTGDNIGEISTHNQRLFIVKVYDSVIQGVLGTDQFETDQLAHAVLIAVDVDNTDERAPSIDIAPFGRKYVLGTGASPTWENDKSKVLGNVGDYTENIVMSEEIVESVTVIKKAGYVQYAAHSGGNADVSGKVVFLGKAEDNQRINTISVTIPGFNGGAGAGSPFVVAYTPVGGGKLTSNRVTMGTGNNAWYFNILHQEMTLDYGHALNWEFGWDSSEILNQVGTPTIIFTINDHKATPNSAVKNLAVNVVPYITEIITPLSDAYKAQASAFARSSTGWYPVRENQEITIKGFNFGLTDGTITGVRIKNGSDVAYTNLPYDDDTTVTTVADGKFKIVSKNEIKANIGVNAISGELEVRVGSTTAASRTSSINNRTTKMYAGSRVAYNWEPNYTNNNNLTNDRKLYVWSVGALYTHTGTMINPFFRMDKNGTRFIGFGHSAGGQSYLYLRKNETNTTGVETAANRFVNTTLAVDTFTNTAGTTSANWYIASPNITAGSSDYNFNFVARAAAGDNRSTNDNKRLLSKMYGIANATTGAFSGSDTDANRYKIPRISVRRTQTSDSTNASSGNPDRIYISYGDTVSTNKPIVFHYGTVGTNTNWGGNFSSTSSVTNLATRQIVASDLLTHKGSIYSAVGSLSNGRPVIAWYDGSNNRLVFSWGLPPGALAYNTAISTANNNMSSTTDTTSGTNNYFQSNAVIIQNGAGSHVDMVVDTEDNVHLAYYDVENGGLYYALIPATGTTSNTNGTRVPDPGTKNVPTSAGNVKVVKVDTFLAAGTKLMLNVRGGIPYISYYHGSFSETKNAIRVAWRNDINANIPAGSDSNDFLTGDWEIMTVPVANIPLADEFVCSGVPATATAWTTVGDTTLNNTYIASNLQDTMLVAYLTNNYKRYEGAVLKK